ncbi:MAG: tetratricopeptide repeat protein [Bacteroidetes bacterium]|nr:tetratricopeptide repeat protein [Bacteroidota bacterium]
MALLKTAKPDTNEVKSLNLLSRLCLHNNPDTARILSLEAVQLATKLKSDKFMGLASLYLGNTFWIKGQYPNAIENYLGALQKFEKIHYKNGIASANAGLGLVYLEQKEYEKSLKYYSIALKIVKDLGDQVSTARYLGNVANIYRDLHEQDTALKYSFAALKIDEETGNKSGMSAEYGNIGNSYSSLGNFTKALEYQFLALQIAEETGDEENQAIMLDNIADSYHSLKQNSKAEKYLLLALAKSDSLGLLVAEKEIYHGLSEIDEESGKYDLALDHYKKYIAARDSLANEENTKRQTQIEMQYDFDKKTSADSIKNSEQKKRDDLKHTQEIQQQKIYSYGGALGFALMLVVAGVSFRAYRNKQKANEIISSQKLLVEMKQKEVIDSINYARRIQKSLLPNDKYIDKKLNALKKD